MKNLARLALALTVAATSTASAQAVVTAAPAPGSTTINFNSLAFDTQISNQFAGLGVTVVAPCFRTNTQYSPYFGGDPQQAQNFDANNLNCAGGATNFPSITFNFSSTINYFGFKALTNNLVFFDNGSPTVAIGGNPTTPTFMGITDIAGFNSITISADVNGAIALDDVSFSSVAVVPEPSSIALMAFGMLAVGGAVRRKQKRA